MSEPIYGYGRDPHSRFWIVGPLTDAGTVLYMVDFFELPEEAKEAAKKLNQDIAQSEPTV